MDTDPSRLERRSTQRFLLNLPISIRRKDDGLLGCGFTHDLSARGTLIYTELELCAGDAIEVTLRMPREVTLAESSMRVCCRGHVQRLLPRTEGMARGVALRLEGYEFLPDGDAASEGTATFGRMSALRTRHAERGGTLPEFVPPV